MRIAVAHEGVRADALGDGRGVRIQATLPVLDAFTAALGHADIGIRGLERVASPLEELFFSMTSAEEG